MADIGLNICGDVMFKDRKVGRLYTRRQTE